MPRKTLTTLLAVLVLAATAGASAAAASAGSKPGRMTICHDPPGNPDGRTMDIPESAWKAHEEHGDHKGACTEADRAGARPPRPDPQVPRTPLSLAVKASAEVDGDATFRVIVRNPGHQAPVGVAVDGTLTGEGRWAVDGDGGRCSVDAQQRLRCAFGDLPAGQDIAFRLRFDGPVAVCEEAAVVLALSASNDSSAGDDRARESVMVGACAPLEPDGAALS